VIALALPHGLGDWRRLAALVTAFTLGHSVTLALATLRLVSVASALAELLIPVTILVTALLSWRQIRLAPVHDERARWAEASAVRHWRYLMATPCSPRISMRASLSRPTARDARREWCKQAQTALLQSEEPGHHAHGAR